MFKIVIDNAIPFVNGVFEPFARVSYVQGNRICRDDVMDADALIVRTRTRCDRALLEGSKVSIIASATIGYDHIDMDYCLEAGIKVNTAKGCNARAVLQWFAASMAYVSANQGWKPSEKKVGVVGVGSVGTLIAEYSKFWGFEVMCCDPPRADKGEEPFPGGVFVSLENVLTESDIVTFHTPLTKSGKYPTYGMVAEHALSLFCSGNKNKPLLLNSARGEIVVPKDLGKYVSRNKIDTVIDTWPCEPKPEISLLENSLLSTPHVAGYSIQGKANAAAMSVNAVAAHLGLPLEEWFPHGVSRSVARKISWQQMVLSIGKYYDIASESLALKATPSGFEQMRDGYNYRTEYF